MSVETVFPKALYEALSGANLGVTGVYDIAPQDTDGGSSAAFPYIVMGDIFAVQNDTQTRVGFEVTNRIHVYSRSGSKAECRAIQGRIFDLLHRNPLSIEGYNHTLQLREDTQCNAGKDKVTHGICEYFGLVELA